MLERLETGSREIRPTILDLVQASPLRQIARALCAAANSSTSAQLEAPVHPPIFKDESAACVDEELIAAALTGAAPPLSSPSPSFGLSTAPLCVAGVFVGCTACVGGA